MNAARPPDQGLADARALIEHSVLSAPRSLQRRIGPSEIGTPCDHCLAAKLAGWEEISDNHYWYSAVGTALHEWLETKFAIEDFEYRKKDQHRYEVEQKVTVGQIGGIDITGSTDLIDLWAHLIIDWKCVGTSTLRTAKKGPSATYRVQANLYAKGWNDIGVRIDQVAIYYLPRNGASLDDAVIWTAPHERQLAVDALDRANRLHDNLAALESISTGARDAWISSLPRYEGCFSCPRYPDGAGLVRPGHHDPRGDLAGLI